MLAKTRQTCTKAVWYVYQFSLAIGLMLSGVASATGSGVSLGLGGGGAIYEPVISPHDPAIMFVACDLGALYRSTDGGHNWTMVDRRKVGTTPIVNGARFGVAFDPVFAGHVIALQPTWNLKESWNNGTDWTDYGVPWDPQIPITAIGFSVDDSMLHVGTTTGVYTRVGGARGWQQTLSGVDQPVVLADGTSGGRVNSAEVINFVSVLDVGGAVLDFVATLTDVFLYNPSTLTWSPFGQPPLSSIASVRPAAPFTFIQTGIWPSQYNASRIRGFAGGYDATGYVLYATIITDQHQPQSRLEPIDTLGGVWRYEGRPSRQRTRTPISGWTQQNTGLSFAFADPGHMYCTNFRVPVYEHLGVVRFGDPNHPNALDNPYVTVLQTSCSPDVYKASRNSTTGQLTWAGVYDVCVRRIAWLTGSREPCIRLLHETRAA